MITRTPTETLMSAMEQFSEAEPKDCLIIWTDEAGDVCWSSSTDALTARIGLAGYMATVLDEQVREMYRRKE
jgi:hypothetical protein